MSQRVEGNIKFKSKDPGVTVAGESFPVFGPTSVASLPNAGLGRDRVCNVFKKKKKKNRTIVDNTW